MRTFNFTGSSAIVDNGITVTDNRANIVFKGNREYVYEITDPASFTMQLEGEISEHCSEKRTAEARYCVIWWGALPPFINSLRVYHEH